MKLRCKGLAVGRSYIDGANDLLEHIRSAVNANDYLILRHSVADSTASASVINGFKTLPIWS